MMFVCVVVVVGYVINIGFLIMLKEVLYFLFFFIVFGVYIIVGLNCVWFFNSYVFYYKWVMVIGMN